MSRYIDADALVIDYYDDYETKDDEYTYAYVSKRQIDSAPTIEPKTKVIAQVTFDENELREIVHKEVERIKEKYDIVDDPNAVSEWIPCEVALPSDGICVLCTDEDDVVILAYRLHGEWIADSGSPITRTQDMPVAWMPLPKPYERSDT